MRCNFCGINCCYLKIFGGHGNRLVILDDFKHDTGRLEEGNRGSGL